MQHKEISDKETLPAAGTRQEVITAPAGEIIVQGPVASGRLAAWDMDDGLRAFRPPDRQKEALITITQMKNGQIFTACHGSTIVGYITFHRPGEFERWSEGNLEVLVELGAVEISPSWRQYGIAKTLVDFAFSEGAFDEYIVLATEYYWHWDLRRSGLTLWDYRKLMLNLMGRGGLTPMETDEPEIASHPANMLMVRIGPKVAKEDVADFHSLLFKEEYLF